VLFFVRFDVKQPDTVSNEQLIQMWQREAEAVLGAIEAGVLKHIWKVAGQRVVLCVIDLPSAEDLDRALGGLPIIREMGNGVSTTALPIYPYETYAEDLNAGVHGG
jgi:muconolactone D-isomerase